MLKAGDKAPHFTLPDSSGRVVSLQDFKGKKLVLFFYPQDDTPTCTKEACAFRDDFALLQAKGAAVLGISPDSVTSHQKFSDKFRLPYQLLSDSEKEMANAYGVWQKKSLFGKKYMGIVRTTFVIDEKGLIIRVFEKVRVKKHIEQVLATVASS